MVRFVLGRLRLGVREMTILDALAERWAGGTKDGRERIEAAFNLCSDLALVGAALADGGLEGLSVIHLDGRTADPARCSRERVAGPRRRCSSGWRGRPRSSTSTTVSGSRPMSRPTGPHDCSPGGSRTSPPSSRSCRTTLPTALKTRPAIVEGECVPIDPDTDEIRPFQECLARRGRKYDLERMQDEVPVVPVPVRCPPRPGRAGRSIEPLPERRERLERPASSRPSGSGSPTAAGRRLRRGGPGVLRRIDRGRGARGSWRSRSPTRARYRAGGARLLVDQVQARIHRRSRRLDRRGRRRRVRSAAADGPDGTAPS